MSKLSNLLKMINLLCHTDRMKIVELVNALNVKERMVRQYAQDIKEAGIRIDSLAGRNGGYKINRDDVKKYLVLNLKNK